MLTWNLFFPNTLTIDGIERPIFPIKLILTLNLFHTILVDGLDTSYDTTWLGIQELTKWIDFQKVFKMYV